MNYKYKRKFDIVICFIFLIILVMGIMFDTCLDIPLIFIIHSDNIENLMSTLFTVQASVATLGIALIALMSEASKEKAYGLTISKFIMQIKPRVFKHRVIIVIQLLMVIVGYIALALKFFNFLEAIFIVSINLIIIMISDIFTIFIGKETIINEIKEYYILSVGNSCRDGMDTDEIFENIHRDIEEALQSRNSLSVNSNVELLNSILDEILKNDNLVYFIKFNNMVSDVLNLIFENDSRNIWYIGIDSIMQFYKKCNDANNNDKKRYLNIFDECFDKLLKVISNMSYNNIIEKVHLYSLQKELYTNVNFSIIDGKTIQKNNFRLNIFSSRLYNLNKRNRENQLFDDEKNILKVDSYNTLKYLANAKFNEFNEEKNIIIYNEFLKYTKILVDEREKEILNKTFFTDMSHAINIDVKNKIFYFSIILLYFYYLAYVENLVQQEEKDFIIDLLEKHKSIIYNFIHKHNKAICTKEFEKVARDTLLSWERMQENQVKRILMEYTIQKFILLNCISFNHNQQSLKVVLKFFVIDQAFSIYSSYLGSKKDKTKNDFIQYMKRFLFRGTDEQIVNSKMQMLEECISEIYKEVEMERCRKEKKDDFYYIELSKKLQDVYTHRMKKQINLFNRRQEKLSRKKKLIFTLISDTDFMTMESLDDELFEYVKTQVVSLVYNIIKPNLNLERKEYTDDNILLTFFDNIEKIDLEMDTLIGYRNWFYGDKYEEKFKTMEEKCNKIESSGNENILVAVNKSKIYFYVNSINVLIQKMTLDDFNDIKKDDNGKYLYNVTNDIYLPFIKEDLLEYIGDTKRKVVFELDYSFGLDQEQVGVGIIFD